MHTTSSYARVHTPFSLLARGAYISYIPTTQHRQSSCSIYLVTCHEYVRLCHESSICESVNGVPHAQKTSYSVREGTLVLSDRSAYLQIFPTHLGDPWKIDHRQIEHIRRIDSEIYALGRNALVAAGQPVRFEYYLLPYLREIEKLLTRKVKELPAA